MKLRTLGRLAFSRDAWVTLAATRHWTRFMRIAFLSAAAESGMLARIGHVALSPEQIAESMQIPHDSIEPFTSWLRLGASLGVLHEKQGKYRARGALAKALARATSDAARAFIAEAVGVDRFFVVEAPSRLRAGRRFALAEQDGPLIARSSRIVEPLVYEAIDAAIALADRTRLLEIGCGSGIYIRRACERSRRLRALGLELQSDVAEMASANLAQWGLADRVQVEAGDVRARKAEPSFDIVTLHNNIYYFPFAERVALLRHLREFLQPKGVVLITTACVPGPPGAEFLSFWGAVTEGCGRCPTPAEMIAQLKQAGFGSIKAKQVLPASGFYYFIAENQ